MNKHVYSICHFKKKKERKGKQIWRERFKNIFALEFSRTNNVLGDIECDACI